MAGRLNRVEQSVKGRGVFRVITHGVSEQFQARLMRNRGVRSTQMGAKHFASGEWWCQVGGAKERGRRSVPEATLKGAWTYIVSGWNPHTYAEDMLRLRIFMSAITRNGASSVLVFPHLPAGAQSDLGMLAHNLGRYHATEQLRAIMTYNFPLTSVGRGMFNDSASALERAGVLHVSHIPVIRLDARLMLGSFFKRRIKSIFISLM